MKNIRFGAVLWVSMVVVSGSPAVGEEAWVASKDQASPSGVKEEVADPVWDKLQGLFKAGDNVQCLKIIESQEAEVRKAERLREMQVICLERIGDKEKALKLCQSLWEDHQIGSHAFRLARLQKEMGEAESAMKTIDAGLSAPNIDTLKVPLPEEGNPPQMVPVMSALLNLKAEILLERNQGEDRNLARQALNDALTFMPEFELAKRNLIRLNALRVSKEQIAGIKEAFPFLVIPLGLDAKQCRERIEQIEATPKYQEDIALLEMRARCIENLGDFPAAANAWDAAFRLSRGALHLMHFALVSLELGEVRNALIAAGNASSASGIIKYY